jgi:lipopolysaccharide assembly LptE-like protein
MTGWKPIPRKTPPAPRDIVGENRNDMPDRLPSAANCLPPGTLRAVRTLMPRGPSRSLQLACLLLLLIPGCGYTVGNGFSPEIKTVSVPIFENDTFRRGIEFQLTEAVQKEIQKRTPYRLAKGLDADTRLTGRIVQSRKDVLGENQFDDPRELQLSLMIVTKWENLRTGEVLAQQEVPLSPAAIPLTTQADFAPEVGQSLATGTQDAVDQLARRIVNMMEAW